jgi:hypothetical protein
MPKIKMFLLTSAISMMFLRRWRSWIERRKKICNRIKIMEKHHENKDWRDEITIRSVNHVRASRILKGVRGALTREIKKMLTLGMRKPLPSTHIQQHASLKI